MRARVVFNKAAPRELLDRLARTDEANEVRDAFYNSNAALLEETVLWLIVRVRGMTTFALKIIGGRGLAPVCDRVKALIAARLMG